MNWEAIGAGGQLIAALGVILSLVYLAVQIRQNTRSVRMAAHHGISNEFNQTNLAMVQDPQLLDLVSRGADDPQSLSDAGRARFFGCMLALFRTYEELFVLSENGLVGPELWHARKRSMKAWLARPGVQSWWRTGAFGSEIFIDSFRVAVDAELERLDSTAAY